ncbi:hypothetical protein PIB30_067848 [Stylosanthes scabra]|uniref:Uncharacterized protein n=1 Tax=Stylosanthes scabra TaxID=79078 RepID=A0ABU6YKW1_9FABA|nr:hypothetical protein [Stylosanthes scabra]
MKYKRNIYGKSILEELQQQSEDPNSNSDVGLDQISFNQDEDGFLGLDMTNQCDDNSQPIRPRKRKTENEPLLVNVKDISTEEIIIRKITAIQIWSLKKSEKVMMELDANGQGQDNGSNLFVRFLGQVARRIRFCPISLKRWDEMPEDNTKRQWDFIERKEEILAVIPSEISPVEWITFVNHYMDPKTKKKISEHLPEDQERAATEGVPSKVLAHPDDAIGKVYGPEYGKRVRGFSSFICLGGFGKSKRIFGVSNCEATNNVSQQHVEDLERQL